MLRTLDPQMKTNTNPIVFYEVSEMKDTKLLTQKRMYILGNDHPEPNVGSGSYIDLGHRALQGRYRNLYGPGSQVSVKTSHVSMDAKAESLLRL